MLAQENPDADGRTRFLDAGAMAGLEAMRFSTRRRVDGSYSGRHVAQRQGGAGLFIDSRQYAPGDDLRRLDWPAMGRTGRAYVRLYQDETNLACLLTQDASGSMHFGARSPKDPQGSKLEWCQFFTTALSHLIVTGRDQVGMAVACENSMQGTRPSRAVIGQNGIGENGSGNVGSGGDTFFRPTASPRQIRLLHEQIAGLRATGTTPLGQALQDLFLRVRRRAVLMVVSDFLVQPIDEVLRALRQFRARGWETIAVHVVHPDEQKLPDGIAYRFTGLEGEGTVDCRPGDIRQVYQKAFADHCRRVRDGLLGAGCDYRMYSTGESYLVAVRDFMIPRSA